MPKTIVIVATLDTRGDEALYLKKRIEGSGCDTIVVDPGIMGEPDFKPDITREEVAKAGGKSLTELVDAALKGASRGSGTAVMSNGLSTIVKNLYERGKLDAIIALGGGTGATLGTVAMKQLPIGIPKLQVCTHPKAQHFGVKDVTIMKSVVDLVGLNSVVRRVLINAASAIVAMGEVGSEVRTGTRPTVGITCWGVVTPAALNMISLLEENGYEPVPVHGETAALEDMIDKELIGSVIDLCAQELIALHIASPVLGGENKPREDRLESAGRKGLPWIFTPGTLDGAFFPLDNPSFKNRRKTEHSPGNYLVRTSKEEMTKLGGIIARKANEAKGPVAVAIPLRSFSTNGAQGFELHDPEADMAFIRAIRSNAQRHVKIKEVDSHINDKQYAEEVVALLDELFRENRRCQSQTGSSFENTTVRK